MATERPWRDRFDRVDAKVRAVLGRLGVPLLRIGLGALFLWFGVLKFFPGSSPAEDLAARTIARLTGGAIGTSLALPGLATWETLIGLGLLAGRLLRVTLLLLAVQLLGTLAPLVLFPEETFTHFPLVPTLEGQYILKNVVLLGAAMVVGASVHGRKHAARREPRCPLEAGPIPPPSE